MRATVSSARTAPINPSESSQLSQGIGCPVGILYLLGSGSGWLMIALVLGFLNSLRFHAPSLLANCSYLTYGRVHAAQSSSLLYGFAAQAALGVGLWLLCRLGRTQLTGSFVVFLGALLWNTAVTIGVIAILCGNTSGFEAFEMPAICTPMLFVAFLMIGICGLLTFHQREEGPLYPSQWFAVGSLFWFPWIFSSAAILLLYMPVRGALQASIVWWYAHNLSWVFLGFAGLACSFYFVPKLLGRALHSRQLAALAFWMLALFGAWGGIPAGAPLPSWITSLSVVGTVLTIVPMVALAMNFYQTTRNGLNMLDSNMTLRFTYYGLLFFFICAAQQIVGVLPQVSTITSLSWFGVAQKELFILGFFGFTVFGAIYHILPRLLTIDADTWCPHLTKAHFGLSLAGLIILYLSLLFGGIGQGMMLGDSSRSFVDAMNGSLMALRMSTLGDLLFLAGTAVFLVNFARVVGSWCCQCCLATRKEAK